MNQIFSALEAGYTPERILKYIQKIDPDLALKVNTAMQGGHSIEQILSFISRNGKKISNAFQPSQRGNIYQEARKSVHPALKNAGAFAIGALAGGAGAYALSRAAPQAAQALQGELLPALPKPPPGPFQPRAQLPAPGQAAIQPAPPVEPEGPLPYTNPSAQNRPIPSQGQPPINVRPQPIPEPMAQTTIPSAPIPQQAVAPLPEALQKQASSLLKARNDIEKVSTALQSLQPKIVKEYEKETGQPIARAVEDFAKQNIEATPTKVVSPEKPSSASGMAIEPKKSEIGMGAGKNLDVQPPITTTPKIGGGKQSLLEEGRKKFDEQMNAQEVPEPTAYLPKKEKGALVALPSGEIGEISDIRQGIATVNANGKEFRRKVEELEAEPEGLDEVARKMVDLIPEGEKSTAFQESIHLNVPTEAGDGIMVTKYYGGKWAWYLGVSNEDYSKIAMGEFEPKGEARTGIAEYKPGVIDSRGAGNQQLIIQNPKYSKANKGKTWDYADTKYNALKSIDPILQKMSRERKDEEGNVIEKREKPIRESSANTRVPESQSKIGEKKEKVKHIDTKKKEPESRLLQKRFDQVAKKLYELKNKPGSNNPKIQAVRLKELANLEDQYQKTWNELRDQLIHEKEMEKLNADIRKEKRESKKPRSS